MAPAATMLIPLAQILQKTGRCNTCANLAMNKAVIEGGTASCVKG